MALSVVDEILEEARAALAERADDGPAPLAVFDADGTLWDHDIGLCAFRTQREAGLLADEVIRGPLKAWAARFDLALDDDGDAAHASVLEAIDSGALVKAGEARGQAENDTLADIYSMHAWSYAGAAVTEVEAHGTRVWKAHIRAKVWDFTRPLVEGLTELGIRAYVLSASPEPILRAAALELGIPPGRVLGMMPDTDDEGRVLPSVSRVVHGPGKIAYLDDELGEQDAPVRPLLAFGDTPAGGDEQLLARARVAVAVGPKGRHLAAAEAAGMRIVDVVSAGPAGTPS